MSGRPHHATIRKSIYLDPSLPAWLSRKATRENMSMSDVVSVVLLEAKAAEERDSPARETLLLARTMNGKLDKLLDGLLDG